MNLITSTLMVPKCANTLCLGTALTCGTRKLVEYDKVAQEVTPEETHICTKN